MDNNVISIICNLLFALLPVIIIAIIIFIIVRKIRRFTQSALGMSPSQAADLISDGLKSEITTPKPITSLSAVYAPQIERDFPQVGYHGMDTLARNTLVAVLNAIESKSTAGLSADKCSPALISKIDNIISDLNSRNASEKYDNIKIHKSGISAYSNKSSEAVATFEISLQYNFSKTENGKVIKNTNANNSEGLVQAAYKVMLTYNQHLHEETTSVVFSSNCPNCGAPIDARNGVCQYCGAGITEIADRIWQVNDYNLFK